ncbi:neutral/alkaline non-lysosomal ceramidase N-terminal domain-containing protein [Flavisolibacter nicotianae]|uniref:neutral/alkaline non-lysosomal ceramidase N-terminal domain-containing protein n=1 Tax=Flavisolibacter nicotianae TaxID=2364882 RepID=UPI0013C50F32|nr:neutral/alkaline non-lysosomal ceramidase N-terminal domain-containing protein [Flavisolibacter nicotianae]
MKNFFISILSAILDLFDRGYSRVIDVPKPKPYPTPKPSQMIAGIEQAELTLPPGYPMSGYSINGRISRGYWIRPKATALYLRDEDGTPFVFVTTDLWAITEAQKMAVLEALHKDPTTWFIGESELLLCAIHAHHSSGTIEFDKAFASTSIGFGLDVKAFDFTIEKIVSAIKGAVGKAEAATLTFSSETIEGIAKNRSPLAYFRNHPGERQEYIPNKMKPEENKFYRSEEEKESTIDQRFTAITIKNAQGVIKGILASYPMHPTATGDATEVYSADVFGLASGKASQELPDNPIVAFYNGAEGDVAPKYKLHNRRDAVDISECLSGAIKRAGQSGEQLSLNGKIIHRTATIDIASNQTSVDPFDADCYPGPHTVAKRAAKPVVGAAVFAGASDGRTSLSSFGISDGVVSKKWDPVQGHKMPAIQFLSEAVLGQVLPGSIRFLAEKLVKIKPKSQLHISIHKVGEVCFVGIPGEFTTMLGRRVRKTVATKLGLAKSSISLVGLADAYISYVTTPREYEGQFYEGASDFFGISTGPAFVNAYRNLAGKDPDKEEERQGRKTRFYAGKAVTFGPRHLGELQTWNAGEGLHNLLVSADGSSVYSHEIPPINQYDSARGPIPIKPYEIIAYSFPDQVNSINSTTFYPTIVIQGEDGTIVPLSEHILTVDQYNKSQSVWTVRILNTSRLADGKTYQIAVIPLSGKVPPVSCPFRVEGFGVM